MLNLKKAFKALLLEQLPPSMPPPVVPGGAMPAPGALGTPGLPPQMSPGAPPAPEGPQQPNVFQLPEIESVVAIFPAEKKIIFSPIDHNSVTRKTRSVINMLKQNFRIDSLTMPSEGMFEIIFDPRENFQSVVDFLKQMGLVP